MFERTIYRVKRSGLSDQLIAHHAAKKIFTPKPLGFGITLWYKIYTRNGIKNKFLSFFFTFRSINRNGRK